MTTIRRIAHEFQAWTLAIWVAAVIAVVLAGGAKAWRAHLPRGTVTTTEPVQPPVPMPTSTGGNWPSLPPSETLTELGDAGVGSSAFSASRCGGITMMLYGSTTETYDEGLCHPCLRGCFDIVLDAIDRGANPDGSYYEAKACIEACKKLGAADLLWKPKALGGAGDAL